MKRQNHQHWIWLILAIVMTVSPAKVRDTARGYLLQFYGHCARLLAGGSERHEMDLAKSKPDPKTQQELAKLKEQNQALRAALVQAGAVPEAFRGNAQLSLVPVKASPLTAASSIQRRLLLHGGQNLGLKKGHSAVVGSGLVGVIVQSRRSSAELRLVLDPSFRIRGKIEHRDVEGLLRGAPGDRLIFEVVAPKGADRSVILNVGEILKTSPNSTLCPIPTVLGRLVKVQQFGALTRAEVVPAIDGRALNSVVVLRPQS